jgi:polyisoprenoid-binding protein YceI
VTPKSVVRYAIDPKASQFTVHAFASGLILNDCTQVQKIAIREWSANATFVPGTLSDARLKVTIKTASLEVLDELRDSDRRELHWVMHEEVLETRQFPEIVFKSSRSNADKQKDALNRVKRGRVFVPSWIYGWIGVFRAGSFRGHHAPRPRGVHAVAD